MSQHCAGSTPVGHPKDFVKLLLASSTLVTRPKKVLDAVACAILLLVLFTLLRLVIMFGDVRTLRRVSQALLEAWQDDATRELAACLNEDAEAIVLARIGRPWWTRCRL